MDKKLSDVYDKKFTGGMKLAFAIARKTAKEIGILLELPDVDSMVMDYNSICGCSEFEGLIIARCNGTGEEIGTEVPDYLRSICKDE